MTIQEFIESLSKTHKRKKLLFDDMSDIIGRQIKIKCGYKNIPHIVDTIELNDNNVVFIVREMRGNRLGSKQRKKPKQLMGAQEINV